MLLRKNDGDIEGTIIPLSEVSSLGMQHLPKNCWLIFHSNIIYEFNIT